MIEAGAVLQSAVVGIITGLFSAGTIYGMLKVELRFMRRDIDELRKKAGIGL